MTHSSVRGFRTKGYAQVMSPAEGMEKLAKNQSDTAYA